MEELNGESQNNIDNEISNDTNFSENINENYTNFSDENTNIPIQQENLTEKYKIYYEKTQGNTKFNFVVSMILMIICSLQALASLSSIDTIKKLTDLINQGYTTYEEYNLSSLKGLMGIEFLLIAAICILSIFVFTNSAKIRSRHKLQNNNDISNELYNNFVNLSLILSILLSVFLVVEFYAYNEYKELVEISSGKILIFISQVVFSWLVYAKGISIKNEYAKLS